MPTRRMVISIVLIIALGSLGAFLWLVRGALYPFFIAVVIAYLLHPFTRALQAQKLSRLGAILIVYLFAIGGLIVFCFQIVPLIIADMRQLLAMLPAMVLHSQEMMDQFGQHYQSLSLPGAVRQEFDEKLVVIETDLTAMLSDMVNKSLMLVRYSLGILISPVLAFYLLYDWDKIKDGFILLVPKRGRRTATVLIKDLDDVLGGVVRGQLIIAAIVGIFVTGGLYYLQVPFAALIGFIAGILDIIPYFGAIIGAVPAVTLALLTSPALAIKVGLLFFVIHQLEGTIIGPKILGESIGLHPLIIIFCLFVGGDLFGVSGMLFAVPVAAILKVCLRHLIAAIV